MEQKMMTRVELSKRITDRRKKELAEDIISTIVTVIGVVIVVVAVLFNMLP